MTISTSTRTAGPFTGTGAAVSYPFFFKVFQAADLLVVQTNTSLVQTTLVLSIDYTVTLNADQNVAPGGTVTPTAAPPAGYVTLLTSNVSLTQPASLTNAGGFFPKTIEDALDRLTILFQQLGVLGSVQTLRVLEVGGIVPLPSAASRANNALTFDSLGNPVVSMPANGTAGSLAANLLSSVSAGLGAAMVGFTQGLGYAASTVGSFLNSLYTRSRLDVWSYDYGHLPTATAAVNDAALVAAWAAVYAAGGGTVNIAAGSFQHVSAALPWTSLVTVNLRGRGKLVTQLVKSGATTTPTLALSNTTGVLDINSAISDMSFVGSASAPGLQMTNCARFTLDRVRASGAVGFNNLGSLVFETHDTDFVGTATGYKQAPANGIYCNLISFNGGLATANTAWGFDLDGGSNIFFNAVDMEVNGTNANLATGGVNIRSTIAAETGESIIGFTGGWMERNHGTPLFCAAAAGLRLSFKNFKWLFNDGSLAATIGAINMVSFDNVNSSDSIVTAAAISKATNSNLSALTDTATDKVYEASQINGVVVPWQVTVSNLTSSVDVSGNLNGGADIKAVGDVWSGTGILMKSSVALLNNAGSGSGTLTNAPTAGNPTKWIRISDNGTLRYIPCW